MTELWVLTTGWTLATLYTALREEGQSEREHVMMDDGNTKRGEEILPVGSSVLKHTVEI